jgi:cytochrome P450
VPERRRDGDGESIADSLSLVTGLAEQVIQHHQAAPDGVVGALIAAYDEGRLSFDEVRGTVVYLLVTSAEPIIGPVSTFVVTLLREHPQRALTSLRNKPELWPDAVSELLRIHHNGMISLPRQALEDVEVGGVLVAKGEAVINPYLAATMDPAHESNPDHFNILRGNPANMTFGGGPHYCLGSSLTRVYLHEALQTLFTELPGLTLAVNPIDIPWMPAETLFTRPRRLPVTF